MLRRALALLLRQLFVPGRSILGPPFLLLVHALAPQRSVARHVAGSLLTPAEQFVQQSHVLLLSRSANRRTRKTCKNTARIRRAARRAEPGRARRSPSNSQEGGYQGEPPGSP